MELDLYSDPSCPWCWTASRWLHAAAGCRDLSVRVRPFSLALLDKPAAPQVALARTWALRALRTASSLDDNRAAAFLDAFSASLFGPDRKISEPDLGDLLEQVGGHRDAAHGAAQAWRDEAIRASMQVAGQLRGVTPGATTTVPILVLHTASGPIAVDGPLVDPAPEQSAAGELWDAFVKVVTADGMFGATRPRRGPHSSVAAMSGVRPAQGRASWPDGVRPGPSSPPTRHHDHQEQR